MTPVAARIAAACLIALATPGIAAVREAAVRVHSPMRDRAEAPRVHHGDRDGGPRTAGGYGFAGGYGVVPVGYWGDDDGREDDAAIFAARYGCARPIWNAKYNRLMAACH